MTFITSNVYINIIDTINQQIFMCYYSGFHIHLKITKFNICLSYFSMYYNVIIKAKY